MDTDFFNNSIQEDHHLAMMLMQMDKLPEFSTSYSKTQEMPINFGIDLPQMVDNNSPAGSATISFSDPPEDNTSAMNLLASKTGKRNTPVAAMREIIFRIASMQPIHIDPESVKAPKRKNVKISKEPQSVAARHRRERISERMRVLQSLVPGGIKMDTASMLDEAIHYVKFLKKQVQSLEQLAATSPPPPGWGFPVHMSCGAYLPATSATRTYHHRQPAQNVHHFSDV